MLTFSLWWRTIWWVHRRSQKNLAKSVDTRWRPGISQMASSWFLSKAGSRKRRGGRECHCDRIWIRLCYQRRQDCFDYRPLHRDRPTAFWKRMSLQELGSFLFHNQNEHQFHFYEELEMKVVVILHEGHPCPELQNPLTLYCAWGWRDWPRKQRLP